MQWLGHKIFTGYNDVTLEINKLGYTRSNFIFNTPKSLENSLEH